MSLKRFRQNIADIKAAVLEAEENINQAEAKKEITDVGVVRLNDIVRRLKNAMQPFDYELKQFDLTDMETFAKWALLKPASKPIDLGWANGWNEEPEMVKKCRELGHKRSNKSDAPGVPYKCSTHTVRCDTCHYFFKYDSS